MKNTLLALMVIVALGSCAKKLTLQEIPQSVQTEFLNRYEKVDDLKWRMKKDVYTACFEIEEKKIEVDFNASGVVLAVRQ